MPRIYDSRIILFLCIILVLATMGCVSNQNSPENNSSALNAIAPNTTNSSRIIAISTSLTHNLALRNNGTVNAWAGHRLGSCYFEQCDVPRNLTNVTAIAAGEGYSVALTNQGTVVVWGCKWDPPFRGAPQKFTVCGDDCPCRVPSNISPVKTISAGQSHILVIMDDGSVAAWGRNGFGQCDVPTGLKNVTAVYAGDTLSLALKEDGTVSAWGLYSGSIPEGRFKGIAAGYRHGLLITKNETLSSFLGAKDNQYPMFDPIYHPNLTNVKAISAGSNYFQALLGNGTVVYWGNTKTWSWEPWGNITELHNITAISSQGLSNLALKDDGTIIEWGF